MYIVIHPSTLSPDSVKPVTATVTIVPNGGDLDGLLTSGQLKVGDEVYTVAQKRTIEAQPPVKFGEPVEVQ